MLRSMTGYGGAEGEVGGRKLFLDVKAVNHRYFNFFAKLPLDLAPFETEMQGVVKAHLSRGQASVFASWDRRNGGAAPVVLNTEAAREIAAALEKLRKELGIGGHVELSHLVAFPALFAPAAPAVDPEALWAEVRGLLEKALGELDGFRLREGRDLEADLVARLAVFSEAVDRVETRRPDILAEQKARLERRLAEIAPAGYAGDPVLADRVALELAVFADRSDISEEIVRLRSHVEKFREMLAEKGAVGRKLDFLLQEMNREVNTVGSKTPDAQAARVVVEMKAELEKIREQVQNVE
ncbi:MAG TPA: YicC/YloC family endoribonuclease [Geobacteraceae bacterium]